MLGTSSVVQVLLILLVTTITHRTTVFKVQLMRSPVFDRFVVRTNCAVLRHYYTHTTIISEMSLWDIHLCEYEIGDLLSICAATLAFLENAIRKP